MKKLTAHLGSIHLIRFNVLPWVLKSSLFVLSALVLLMPTRESVAQSKNAYWVYANIETIERGHEGYAIQLQYVSPKRYAFVLGMSEYARNATQPMDYTPQLNFTFGAGDFDIFGFNLRPIDYFRHVYLLGGKTLSLSKRGAFRIQAISGLSLGIFRDVVNWTPIESKGIFNTNYAYEHAYRFRPSLMLQPKFEWAFHKYIGISVSPLAIINTHRNFYGFRVGAMVGQLR